MKFLNDLPLMLLALPAVLLSLSVHEASHGYAAYKLGDNTAKNLGRLTLNPLKHINVFGFISMLLFSVGWANPVPINPRNFKDSRKGMAISAAAGPLSNLCLAIIFTILLRLVLIPIEAIANNYATDIYAITGPYGLNPNNTYWINPALSENTTFIILSLLAVLLYLGIGLNINLMFFNLIPLPPLDGSRIAYIFLPSHIYFKIMQYERYIMIGFIVLLATGILTLPLGRVTGGLTNILYTITGMPEDLLTVVFSDIVNKLPKFTL